MAATRVSSTYTLVSGGTKDKEHQRQRSTKDEEKG